MTDDGQLKWCLYIHTNKTNGKKYVGITSKEPSQRWGNGRGYADQVFGKAIKKYGWENFNHEIIEEHLSEKDAQELEKRYIRELNTTNPEFGYNISEGGGLPPDLNGEKNPFYGKAPIKAIEVSIANRTEKHLTEEHKRNISDGLKKYTRTDEHNKHLAESRKNNPMPTGENAHRAKKVLCEETGKIFGCQKELAEYLDVSASFVSKIVRKHLCHRGFHYIFLAKA